MDRINPSELGTIIEANITTWYRWSPRVLSSTTILVLPCTLPQREDRSFLIRIVDNGNSTIEYNPLAISLFFSVTEYLRIKASHTSISHSWLWNNQARPCSHFADLWVFDCVNIARVFFSFFSTIRSTLSVCAWINSNRRGFRIHSCCKNRLFFSHSCLFVLHYIYPCAFIEFFFISLLPTATSKSTEKKRTLQERSVEQKDSKVLTLHDKRTTKKIFFFFLSRTSRVRSAMRPYSTESA